VANWAFATMSLSILNAIIGAICLTGLIVIMYRNRTKVNLNRRLENDEDDPLLQYSALAAYILVRAQN